MAIAVRQDWVPKFVTQSALFRFLPRNRKSKPSYLVSTTRTPTNSGNGTEALNVHEVLEDKPFQRLEIQIEMSDSAPIAALQGSFEGNDYKGINIKDKGKEKADDDEYSSASSSHMEREMKEDIEMGISPPGKDKDTNKDDPLQVEDAIETLRKNKLVGLMMGLSLSTFFSLFTFHNPNDMNLGMRIFMHLLPISSVAFFLGIALHKKYPEKSDKIKLVGYEFFFLGIFGIMASFVGLDLAVIPILCAVFVTVLLVMVFFDKL